jgi:hypothetical protein
MLTRRNEAAGERPFNNLLRRLNSADFALLEPHLTAADTGPNDLLYNPGDNVEIVHFPCGPSLVSYMVPNEDGRDVETILIGREGAVGGIVSQGYLPAYTRIMVKFGGPFVRMNQICQPAQHFCPLCRLHAGPDLPVHGLQCHPFDRTADGEMDHFGDGTHRWR